MNCTGYLLKGDQQHEPVVSPSGRVPSINMRAHTLWLTPWSGYFLTHLFLRDQLEVARRVERTGAGIRLPKRHLQPHRLRTAVHEAINRREHAQHLAHALHNAGGPVSAADLLEHHLTRTLEPDPID